MFWSVPLPSLSSYKPIYQLWINLGYIENKGTGAIGKTLFIKGQISLHFTAPAKKHFSDSQNESE